MELGVAYYQVKNEESCPGGLMIELKSEITGKLNDMRLESGLEQGRAKS